MTTQQAFVGPDEIGRDRARVFIEWRALSCPKAEYTTATTEDRYAQRAPAGLFAVADGVGSSFRAAEWAQAVVDDWARAPFHSQDAFEVEGWLRKLQPAFVMRPEEIAALQPYAQGLARKGAGATFLGLRLWPARDGQSALYSLLCVGDSVMIHYNKGVFPIFSAAKFGSYPTVLRSRGFDRERERVLRYPPPDERAPAHDRYQRLSPGESLLLCTDALAHWALETDNASLHVEADGARAQLDQQTAETWPGFIEDLRRTGRIVDDDTTAVFIRIAADQHSASGGEPDPAGWRRVELSAANISKTEEGWEHERRRNLEEALRQKPVSAIEVARVFGDGWYFRSVRNAEAVKDYAVDGRRLAGELEKVNAALRDVTWDQPTPAQLERVADLQRRYGEALAGEPAAQGALATMRDLLGGAPITRRLDLEEESGLGGGEGAGVERES
jgi:hypothetical protein